jgi:HSP20 family protein
MAERKHHPFQGLFDHFAEMNRMRASVAQAGEEHSPATAWIPACDIFAEGEDIVIRCELAGVGKDEVHVALAGSVLTIAGERTDPPRDVNCYVRERHYGPFRRTIGLPESVEREDVGAVFENGLLEVTVAGAARPAADERIEIAGPDGQRVKVM